MIMVVDWGNSKPGVHITSINRGVEAVFDNLAL